MALIRVVDLKRKCYKTIYNFRYTQWRKYRQNDEIVVFVSKVIMELIGRSVYVCK